MDPANIVPSKPFHSFQEIESLAKKVKGKIERIQVDICDGEYVENLSWPFTEMSKEDFGRWSKIGLKDNAGLRDLYMPEPYDLNYTADMMCFSPEKYLETLVAYGFDEIIVHWRAIREDFLAQEKILQVSVDFSLMVYLAVDVQTNIEEVKNFFHQFAVKNQMLSGVQVMGIEKIGWQGQKFDERSLDLVGEFRIFFDKELSSNLEKQQKYQILFDGGINDESLPKIKNAGVDVFCVGHWLTDGNFTENLKEIQKKLA